MKSAVNAFIGAILLASSIGCAMCDTSLVHDYASFGGVVERSDQQHGRVGSSSFPASAPVGTLGSLAAGFSESSSVDRPRDLDPPNGAGDGAITTPDSSDSQMPQTDGAGDSIDDILDSIPDLDEEQYRDLLEQIPGDASATEFPGEVNAVPMKNSQEVDFAVELVASEVPASTANVDHLISVLVAEPQTASSVMEQLDSAIVDE